MQTGRSPGRKRRGGKQTAEGETQGGGDSAGLKRQDTPDAGTEKIHRRTETMTEMLQEPLTAEMPYPGWIAAKDVTPADTEVKTLRPADDSAAHSLQLGHGFLRLPDRKGHRTAPGDD